MRRGNILMAGSVVKAVTVLGLAVLAGATSIAWGEEDTVRALSSARAQGFFFETGERRALFVGAFHGMLYIDTGPNALDGASLVCPMSYLLDRFQPSYTAEGYCTFVRTETDKLYARWTCAGGQPRSCVGRLILEGGTGRFVGVSGESELVVHWALPEFTEPAIPPAALGARVVVRETASVLLILPALRYRFP